MSEVNTGKQSSIVRVAIASLIGTSIEWYDFFLYGAAATVVLGPLFFSPKLSPVAATLSAFATFAVGFLARPVGGIVFGHYGDKLGRKTMLVLTLMIMGISTFLVGCLPPYSVAGVWAPILLVILRFAQGFAVGGEWGGAVLIATEHSPSARRGFYGSWPQMGVPVGVILSSLIFSWASSTFSHQDFLAYGWRIPFWLSIVLIAVGLFIRLRIEETPDFEQVKQSEAVVSMPVIEVLRHNWKTVLLAGGAFFVVNGSFYIFITFIVSYGTTLVLHLPASVFFNATLAGAVISLIVLPLSGIISDRTGRLPIYLAGAVVLAVAAFPMFWLIDTKNPGLIILALCIGQFGLSMMYGPQAAFFSELFGANVRYSGASLGYQLASVLAGGLAPTIATALIIWSSGGSWSIALYLIAMSIITLVSTYFAGETRPRAVREGIATEGAAGQ
ncbi:MAG: MHS family MFS transporter [Ktedonobacteraceae bacterium]|nr:MHS family MFS transporter [Ktedonobacteraceae bacterium]